MKTITSIIFLLFALLAYYLKAQNPIAPALITVSGIGYATTKPDEIQVDITIVERDRSPDTLTELMSNQSAKIISILHDANVTDADIDTSKVSMWPYYTTSSSPYVTPGPDHYTAQQSIVFTLRNLSDYDPVMTKLNVAGIDSVDSVTFQLSNDLLQEKKLEAKKNAAENLNDTLSTLVEGLGLKIGSAYTVSEYSSGGDPQAYNGYQNSRTAVFQSGEVVIAYEDADGYGGGQQSTEPSFLPENFQISSTINAQFYIV